jgi:hypothetical protein
VGKLRQELTDHVMTLIGTPSNLLELWKALGAVAGRCTQRAAIFTRWLNGLAEEIEYQYDIPDNVRGDPQVMWRPALDFSEPVGHATREDRYAKDETSPRRSLPF